MDTFHHQKDCLYTGFGVEQNIDPRLSCVIE